MKAFLFLLVFTQLALADFKNRGAFPFGEIESFIGNAGTGGTGSTGAVYYNPAALVELTHPKIAVSGSSYYHFKTDNENLLRIDNTDLNYTAGGFNTAPSSVVSTFRNDDFSWAYFILVPESLQIENRVSWNTPNVRASIVQLNSNSELWLGTAGAKQLSPEWALGAAIYVIRHTNLEHNSSLVDTLSAANTTSTSISHLSDSVYGLSISAGALYKPLDWLSIGYRIQSPLIHVMGSGSVYVAARTVDNGTVTTTNFAEENLPARYAMPLDMTLGFKLLLQEGWAMYLDTSLQTGVEYTNYPGTAVSTVERSKATPRLNWGSRLSLSTSSAISLGFFLNPGASDVAAATANAISDIDYMGVTSGFDFAYDRVKTGIGVFYAWSNSESPQFNNPSGVARNKIRFIGALINIGYYL